MTTSLIYRLLHQILQMLTQLARDGGAKDVELLVRPRPAAPRPRRTSSSGPSAPSSRNDFMWRATGGGDCVTWHAPDLHSLG
jgi:hypothetical protein